MKRCSSRWKLAPRGVGAGAAVLVLAGGAAGQCGQSSPFEVDSNYAPTPAGGFITRDNVEPGSVSGVRGLLYDFAVPASGYPAGLAPLLADPTVVRIGSWYYITGTSNGLVDAQNHDVVPTGSPWQSDFAIYRTRNFKTFEFHSWAFQSTPAANSRVLDLGAGGRFSNLQSPQLFTDPHFPDSVFIAFSAVQEAWVPQPGLDWSDPASWQTVSNLVNTMAPNPDVDQNWVDPNDPTYDWTDYVKDPARLGGPGEIWHGEATRFASCYIAACDKSDFEAGTGRFGPIAWFGYNENNAIGGPWRYDGGTLVGHWVPASGTASLGHPAYGLLETCSNACTAGSPFLRHASTSATKMVDGPFIFLDPQNDNQRWGFYTWVDGGCGYPTWQGVHTAGHKMLNDSYFMYDSTAMTFPLAFRWNSNNPITARLPACDASFCGPEWDCGLRCTASTESVDNGLLDQTGRRTCNGWGFAEGPAVFYYPVTGKYYAIYSRNAWTSPGYQLMYRMADTVEGLGIGTFNNSSATEYVLLRSERPTSVQTGCPEPCSTGDEESADDFVPGRNFGHADVFHVDWPGEEHPHPYIVVHFKCDESLQRRVFFKELRFDLSTGRIMQLYDDHPYDGNGVFDDPSGTVGCDYRYDISKYVVPLCRADADDNGSVDSADISGFLSRWNASISEGNLDGDFDGSGVVNSGDISAFMGAWSTAVVTGWCW